jgi:hypothetical protein
LPDRSVHGEKDLAIEQLNAATPLYGASSITSYGVLKLMLFWDPLRGDPRFPEDRRLVRAEIDPLIKSRRQYC